MIKMVALLLRFTLLFLLLPVNAQENINILDANGQRQGEWIGLYENGNIRYHGQFLNDKPVNELKRYFEKGGLMAIMQYSIDNDTVSVTLYHPNGFISAKGVYFNQKKIGTWDFFSDYAVNTLLGKENYLHDKREGESTKYHWNGNLAEKTFYLNDNRTGEWIQYYTDGTLALRGNYIDGKLNGLFEAYNTDRTKMLSGNYNNDIRDGEWQFYGRENNIKSTISYNMGVARNSLDLLKKETDFLDDLEKRGSLIADPAKTGVQW